MSKEVSGPLGELKRVVVPEPGEVITSLATGNTFVMGEQLGEGHFGVAYACTDVWDNQLAAKVLKPVGSYEEVRAKAEAEFQKLLFLRHPFITFVYDAFEYRDTFYIVTERCEEPVSSLFSLPDYLVGDWGRPVARCILQAVAHVHGAGLVHQDIHLGNVFTSYAYDEVAPDEYQAIQFKLADLGVAKVAGDLRVENTRAQWMLPPEVLDPDEFGPIDYRVDIYHLGLLFLQLALGKELSFTVEEVLAGAPRALALTLPAPYNFALEKALRRHAVYRTASSLEMWRDLNSPAE
ncbi:MAG: protein kinase [Gemmatimonadaceae bacterium]|nr:protein kinase [Gemmatimonadaceae bacterium]MCW5826836.1 protein kinase [Gemmatimonadaceae bacterium]